MGAKQRKKTDKASKEAASGDGAVSLNEQLDRAQAAVERNHHSALKLQQQWRTHMLRMSYVVMAVTLHQAQTPTTSCVKAIKEFNIQSSNGSQLPDPISGWQAIVMVLHDSVVELLGIVCASCILWCLSMPLTPSNPDDFTTIPYRLSCVVIPMIVSIYFTRKGTPMGCLPNTLEDPADAPERGFPVILVFHLIVSGSLWFMKHQTKQHDKNVEMVQKLKQELVDARKGKTNSKQK